MSKPINISQDVWDQVESIWRTTGCGTTTALPFATAIMSGQLYEREECARVVETALVEDFRQRTGKTRDNSEAEVFLARAIRSRRSHP